MITNEIDPKFSEIYYYVSGVKTILRFGKLKPFSAIKCQNLLLHLSKITRPCGLVKIYTDCKNSKLDNFSTTLGARANVEKGRPGTVVGILNFKRRTANFKKSIVNRGSAAINQDLLLERAFDSLIKLLRAC